MSRDTGYSIERHMINPVWQHGTAEGHRAARRAKRRQRNTHRSAVRRLGRMDCPCTVSERHPIVSIARSMHSSEPRTLAIGMGAPVNADVRAASRNRTISARTYGAIKQAYS